MCAINGITREDRALVTEMNEATRHRGPDGSRVWEGRGITLGHNRLAIIDLEERAAQPMATGDGRYTIVFNGEIYNYRELKEELRSQYVFRTESDTEVLLAAYATWGEAVFPKLRGIFAFGIWDSERGELTLARDHMGVKPLYYRTGDGVVCFSSELPALLIGMRERKLSREQVGFYLAMEYVPGPETLVSGIWKLRPGEVLRFKDGVLRTASFLEDSPGVRSVSPHEVYDTIDAAVKRQLVSDRPIGAYLSGGFDSSIVVHHMAKHEAETRTYSVDFEAVTGQEADTVKFNADARIAERTARHYGTKHTTFTVTLDDIRNTIERASASASEPVANSTAITQYLLSDFVRKDGTVVVLGGDGGDELFGGYTRHRIAVGAHIFQSMPEVLQRALGRVSPRVAKLGTPFGTPFHRAVLVKDEKKIAPFLTAPLPINDRASAYFDGEYTRLAGKGLHPIDAFMRVDRRTWLPDECFVRSDYASMAHGVELRVPIADIDVVRLSDQISIWKKTLPHEGKRIVRSAYRSHLPGHLYGQPKRGWLSPAAKWFRDPVIGDLARNVFSGGYYDGLNALFDWGNVQALLADHVEKRGYHLYPLWNILVLQVWARKNKLYLEP